MKEKIEEVYFVVETAKRAMESLSIEPKIEPVRELMVRVFLCGTSHPISSQEDTIFTEDSSTYQ